ncbi:MAG TPA: cytochrome c3 family protein [Pyrinomonadaceae bacterium]|nr:cytochrome c3 family protein [Pyrinomonadaceae bacterium]
MRRVFHRSANTLSRVTIFGFVFLFAAVLWITIAIGRSSYVTDVGVARPQPVPFSHQHHAGNVGIDCRYCHVTVETSAFAGMPATQICMQCHSQIWSTSPLLEPVRASFSSGHPLQWTRVHNLPRFTYFDHSIHVKQGVGCSTCHGRVDQMSETVAVKPMYMEWCVDCHRNVGKYLRPREEVFNMNWQLPANQLALGGKLIADYHIKDARSLIACSTCHR